ncbi:MAG: transposase [Phormidium sp.]
MAIRRTTFRIYPTKTQERVLFGARRLHSYLYNACIANRRYEWKANKRNVSYLEQQNCLPEFKKEWLEFASLHSQSLQATVKRVDLAYGAFFQGIRQLPKFKSIRNYSGWCYPAKSGWKINSNGKHGRLILNDLGINLKLRGKASCWGVPTTLTIVYRPSQNQWVASITIDVTTTECKFGSESDLSYKSIVAFDLGTQTALTLDDGREFTELENSRFTKKAEAKIKHKSKALRRKRAPNRTKKIVSSRRWKKARKQISKLQGKVANQRRDWQLMVTSEIARHYDIGVTEQLNTKNMTRQAKKGSKRKKQKAGLNKSILSVGFGTLNQMIAYKIEQKGGLMLMLPTKQIKPSQRCPKCGAVHKEWADLSNRYHICSDCGFEIPRDRGSVMVFYHVAINQQPELGTNFVDCRCSSSTTLNSKRKHTGSMQKLGQLKRQKSCRQTDGILETPSVHTVG